MEKISHVQIMNIKMFFGTTIINKYNDRSRWMGVTRANTWGFKTGISKLGLGNFTPMLQAFYTGGVQFSLPG